MADFGFATFANRLNNETVCGTPGYIAPEALKELGYNEKSDIFSVGSILYNILTLKNLFHGRNYRKVLDRNKECDLSHVIMYMRGTSRET